MPGRILGGLCGNVRLFSVPPPPFLLPPSLFLSCSLRVVLSSVLLFLFLLFLVFIFFYFFFFYFFYFYFFFFFFSSSTFANLSFFFVWADSTIRSSLAFASLRPLRSFRALVLFIEAACLRVPLGSSGSPSAVHSLRGMPYIYAR